MADRIPYDVFHGTPQDLFESVERARIGLFDHHAAILRARFEIAIVGNLLHQIRQVECRRRPSIHTAIDPRQRQQLTDQRIQPPRFQADSFQAASDLKNSVNRISALGRGLMLPKVRPESASTSFPSTSILDSGLTFTASATALFLSSLESFR